MTGAVHPALGAYTRLVAGSTFLLLIAGGMVTSTGSGLSVPDWPLSFGQWMPEMEGGVLFEHGHRMVATFVGLLIVIEAIWMRRSGVPLLARRLGWIAVAGVVVQGLLGGLTVLLRLPDIVSVSHAGLAEIVFAVTVAIALVTSRGWQSGGEPELDIGVPSVATLAVATTALIYVQILLGAVVRHTGAGLAIPDFPLAYGQLIPPLSSRPVALHFAHRVGAIVVAGSVLWTAWRATRLSSSVPIRRTALLLVALVVVQITLGGWTVLSFKAPWIATLHLGTGALLLVTALVLAARAVRDLQRSPVPAHPPHEPLIHTGAS